MFKVIASLILLVGFMGYTSAGKELDDPIITPAEIVHLNRLKQILADEFTTEYMKKDVYLIKWLRSTKNLKEAVEKLQKMLEWRKEINMDQILEEDFSDFEQEFPFTMNSIDYIGRPVATADISDWDVRKIIITGRRDKAIRFIYRMAEIGILQIMEAHERNPNVTSSILLANLKGFNTKIHSCHECIPIYKNLIISMENFFPNMIHKLIGINTPMSFYSLFTLFVPIMSRNTMSIVKFYGTDIRQWKPVILSLIPANQLESQFGGTKKGPHEL